MGALASLLGKDCSRKFQAERGTLVLLFFFFSTKNPFNKAKKLSKRTSEEIHYG